MFTPLELLGVMVIIYAVAEIIRYINLKLDDNNSQSPIQYWLIGLCFILWFLSLPVAIVLGTIHHFHVKRLLK